MQRASHGWPRVFGDAGWIGVDLFFVLSGYLITGILSDTRDSDTRARSFYVRRALRIFPLYYAVLFALFVIAPAVHPISWAQYHALVPEQVWYWTYLADWRMAFAHPPTVTLLGHFWTLSIEEQRTVLDLKHLQGRSVAEICQLLGRSEASVAGLLRRGLKSLREVLAGGR